MFLQVCRDYPAIGNALTLRMHQVRYFYRALMPELRSHTKPQAAAKPARKSRRRK